MADDKNLYYGYNGQLLLTDTGIVIKRSGLLMSFLSGGMFRGDKTIPYSSIVAVQFRRAGIQFGYIQFSIRGGGEAKGGLMEASKDENSITFLRRSNESFEEAKSRIEARMNEGNSPKHNSLDDLEKLAELKSKGIITQEEFDLKKKSLLGI